MPHPARDVTPRPLKLFLSAPVTARRVHRTPAIPGRDRRGTVTLELAAALVPLLVLGVMEIGYDLFVQEALDSAVNTAARLVFTGQQTGQQGYAAFVQNAVCPAVANILECRFVYVNVQPVPAGADYYTMVPPALSPGANTVCTGSAGQFMLLQAWYTGPTFLGALFPSFSASIGGSLTHVTYASAGFVNEQFVGGQPC